VTLRNFPAIDTPPLEDIELSAPFENWLGVLADTINALLYTGKYEFAGGSAASIPVEGLTSQMICFAQIESSANAVSVQKVTPVINTAPTLNTLDVLFSGDPGESVINYLILRTV
jgi:hypothetical protein